jgi:hypothetical protein
MVSNLICFLNNKKNQGVIAFFIVVMVFILFQQHKNIIYFPSDSGDYWKLSATTILKDFPKESFRGYFFPLLLWPAHWLTDVLQVSTPLVYRIYSSIIYAYALTLILPNFYIEIFGGVATIFRRLISPCIVLLLFPGIILYPLSDLPSFILMSCSIATLLSLKKISQLTMTHGIKIAGAGCLAYGAYNTRTIYLFPLIGVFLFFPLILGHGKGIIFKCLIFLILIAGGSVVSVPQSIINLKNYNKFTPFVQANSCDKSLFALQLMWGITVQRYATIMVSPSEGAGMYAMDPSGIQIFEKEKLSPDTVSIKKYFQLLVKRPLFFIGSYTRHIINGMDLRDGECYCYGLIANRNIQSTSSFLLIFIGGLIIYLRRTIPFLIPKKREIKTSFKSLRKNADDFWWIYLFLILLPVIAIIPGAIESRFFLPVQLLIYFTLAFNGDIGELLECIKNKSKELIIIFVCTISMFFAVVQNTASMETQKIDVKYIYVDPNR